MRANEHPRWEPTPEEIREQCEMIRAEKLEAENQARIVGERNAKMWNVPVVKTRSVPPSMPRTDYQ